MADWELIQEKTISGVGNVQYPLPATTGYREYKLYGSVIRLPAQEYANLKYPVAKRYYGKILFLFRDYVVAEAQLNFRDFLYTQRPDETLQNLIAIKCAYAGILDSFYNLAAGFGFPIITRLDLIRDFAPLSLSYDRVVISCYDACAIRLSLHGLFPDSCNFDSQDPPPRPPDVNRPATFLPPTSPVSVSPDEGGEKESGYYDPYILDVPPRKDDLPGESGVCYTVTVRVFADSFGAENPRTYSSNLLAPIPRVGLRFEGNLPIVSADSQGQCTGTSAGSDYEEIFIILNPGDDSAQVEIVSFEPT